MMRKLLIRAGVLAGLFLNGLLLGWLSLLMSAENPVDALVVPGPLPTPANGASLAIYTPQQHLQLGEQLLLSGDPFQALPHFLNAAEDPLRNSSDQLIFRIALCYESSGDFPRAQELYRHIAKDGENHWIRLSSKRALARCYASQKQFHKARQLLWNEYLVSDGNRLETFAADVRYELIQSFPLSGQHQLRDLLIDGRVFILVPPAARPEMELKKLLAVQGSAERSDAPRPPADPATSPPAERINISNVVETGDTPAAIFCDASIQGANLAMALRWISEKLRVSIEITPDSIPLVQAQNVDVELRGMELPGLLDALTLPFDLAWEFTGDTCVIFTQDQATPETILRVQQQAVDRMIQRTVLMDPEHRHAIHARITHALLQHLHGKTPAAVAQLQELLKQRMDRRWSQHVHFALAKIYESQFQLKPAQEALERVVEANELGPLRTIAYLKLGRLNLENHQPKAAVLSYSRALRSTDDPYLRQIALVGVASVYLWNGQLHQSNQLIVDRSRELTDPQIRRFANFMATFARSRMEARRRETDSRAADDSYPHEQVEFLAAVTQAPWLPELGPQSHFLISQAYQSLGFHEESVAHLKEAFTEPMAPYLRQRVVDQLASELISNEQFDEARQLVIRAMQSGAALDGSLPMRLAEMEFAASNATSCEAICREILANSDFTTHHAAALTMLGKLFQGEGKHYQAALCFSGLLPK